MAANNYISLRENLFLSVAQKCTKDTTKKYSTSFSFASKLFPKNIRTDIYNVYALVRIADEIVDGATAKHKNIQLKKLHSEVIESLSTGFSTNLIVHAFVNTAIKYNISKDLINPFFRSMELDLTKFSYDQKSISEYIYGSAEVIALICLKIFLGENQKQYSELKNEAQNLGSAFQKINFLRDIKEDWLFLKRSYFPNITPDYVTDGYLKQYIVEVKNEYNIGYDAVKKLPKKTQNAVYFACDLYGELLNKISNAGIEELLNKRLRLNGKQKIKTILKNSVKRQLSHKAKKSQYNNS